MLPRRRCAEYRLATGALADLARAMAGERPFDGPQQLVGVDGLHQALDRPVTTRTGAQVAGLHTGHQDDGRRLGARLDAANQLQAVHDRHLQVGQDQVRATAGLVEPVEPRQRAHAVIGRLDGETRLLEQPTQSLAGVAVIVDDQNRVAMSHYESGYSKNETRPPISAAA